MKKKPYNSSRDKKVLWKSVIVVEVLSEQPFEYDTLEDVHYAITHGGCSGNHDMTESKHLTMDEAVKECEKQGTDPVFFFGDEE